MASQANSLKSNCHLMRSLLLRPQLTATAFVGSAALVFLALAIDAYRPYLVPTLLPVLLVALCMAVSLTVFSLLNVRSEHHGTDKAFRNTDCEFSSIFENVLGGILIVDNDGCCLDANPAAAELLRLPTDKLIGQNIARFLADRSGLGLTCVFRLKDGR